MYRILVSTLILLVSCGVILALETDFHDWTLEEAAGILNESSWATQETDTRVVGGIGSGIQGDKEIYNTYFVRFLSAAPVRHALVRLRQLQLKYDELSLQEKEEIDQHLQQTLSLDVRHWIVVAVSFRSNNQREQSRIERFFDNQTTETIKTRAYLSSESFPRTEIQAYFPPQEWTVGAKFVFPRYIDGEPVVDIKDGGVVFELDTPGNGPILRAQFEVEEMFYRGRLEL